MSSKLNVVMVRCLQNFGCHENGHCVNAAYSIPKLRNSWGGGGTIFPIWLHTELVTLTLKFHQAHLRQVPASLKLFVLRGELPMIVYKSLFLPEAVSRCIYSRSSQMQEQRRECGQPMQTLYHVSLLKIDKKETMWLTHPLKHKNQGKMTR